MQSSKNMFQYFATYFTISIPKINLAQNKHYYKKNAELAKKFATW